MSASAKSYWPDDVRSRNDIASCMTRMGDSCCCCCRDCLSSILMMPVTLIGELSMSHNRPPAGAPQPRTSAIIRTFVEIKYPVDVQPGPVDQSSCGGSIRSAVDSFVVHYRLLQLGSQNPGEFSRPAYCSDRIRLEQTRLATLVFWQLQSSQNRIALRPSPVFWCHGSESRADIARTYPGHVVGTSTRATRSCSRASDERYEYEYSYRAVP